LAFEQIISTIWRETAVAREASGVVPDRREVAVTERVVAERALWVLHALFAHARHLGLGRPPAFW
jgi:hypothetical protein